MGEEGEMNVPQVTGEAGQTDEPGVERPVAGQTGNIQPPRAQRPFTEAVHG